MTRNEKSQLVKEIESRLDARFGESDREAQGAPSAAESDLIESRHSLLGNLKTSILSMLEETARPIPPNFELQLDQLEKAFTDNRMACAYLRIMRFLSRYVQAKGAGFHPGAVNLLVSIYNHLETVTLSGNMPEAKKWNVFEADITQYKALVEELDLSEDIGTVEQGRVYEARELGEIKKIEPPQVLQNSAESPESAMSPHEAFALALDEIKNLIRAEFSAIRAELKMWRESK
jgi:hypothetical protein